MNRIPRDLAARIRLVMLDVDGVLTDGGIYLGAISGGERFELTRRGSDRLEHREERVGPRRRGAPLAGVAPSVRERPPVRLEVVLAGAHGPPSTRSRSRCVGTLSFRPTRIVGMVPAQQLVYVIFMGNYQRADQLQRVFQVQNLVHGAVQ